MALSAYGESRPAISVPHTVRHGYAAGTRTFITLQPPPRPSTQQSATARRIGGSGGGGSSSSSGGGATGNSIRVGSPGPSRFCKPFAATMPVMRRRTVPRVASALQTRLLRVALTTAEVVPAEEDCAAATITSTMYKSDEYGDEGLRLTDHQQRIRDHEPCHAQLLQKEREQHRVAMDRVHQKVGRLKSYVERERAAHAATSRLVLLSQQEACAAEETAARNAVAATEARELLELHHRLFLQLVFVVTAGPGLRACNNSSRSISRNESDAPPQMFNAHDSDLLRALQRAEARIAHLETQHEQCCCSASLRPCDGRVDGVEESGLHSGTKPVLATAAAVVASEGTSAGGEALHTVHKEVTATCRSAVPSYTPLAPYICTVYAPNYGAR